MENASFGAILRWAKEQQQRRQRRRCSSKKNRSTQTDKLSLSNIYYIYSDRVYRVSAASSGQRRCKHHFYDVFMNTLSKIQIQNSAQSRTEQLHYFVLLLLPGRLQKNSGTVCLWSAAAPCCLEQAIAQTAACQWPCHGQMWSREPAVRHRPVRG